jgi:segregation and condensation protein A
MEAFKVNLEQFEGPLDLLLDLIEKRKLHINDISLASVTDDFIEHVKNLEEEGIPHIAHFVLVASTLLLIKSKSLLPNLSLTMEESADVADLEERLKTLERMRALSFHIKERFGKTPIFSKSEQKVVNPIFSPEETITPSSIRESIKKVLLAIPIKELIPQAIVKKVVSIEEMIERLVTRIQSNLRTSFKQFAGGERAEKVHVIVGFLAMLELVKQGIIAVTQEDRFSDITMETAEIGVPTIS